MRSQPLELGHDHGHNKCPSRDAEGGTCTSSGHGTVQCCCCWLRSSASAVVSALRACYWTCTVKYRKTVGSSEPKTQGGAKGSPHSVAFTCAQHVRMPPATLRTHRVLSLCLFVHCAWFAHQLIADHSALVLASRHVRAVHSHANPSFRFSRAVSHTARAARRAAPPAIATVSTHPQAPLAGALAPCDVRMSLLYIEVA